MSLITQDTSIGALVTIQQAAQRRGVSVSTVYKAMREGKLVTTRVLGRHVLRVADVDAWQPATWGGPRRNKQREDVRK